MTATGISFMRDNPHILLERFSEYVRPYPAKVLAQTLDCTERTAENFRRGTSWPTARHWRLIVRAFGRDVLAAVFMPEIDDTLARLEREARQLEKRLAEVHARRAAAAGGVAGLYERRAEDTPREAVEPAPDLFEDAC